MIERSDAKVWDILEEIIDRHPVMLNRAPTLHRLGIQAFEPVLTEGRAITLHPLVCTAYNADFDGDQMAVHLPLSVEAQAEARLMMMSVNNILAPKDGKPVAVPTQDMVLGAYYMTIERPGAKGESNRYSSLHEALMAYYHKYLDLQAKIWILIPNEDIVDEPKNEGMSLVETTIGNAIYNEELPKELRFFSKRKDEETGKEYWHLGQLITKKELGKLVAKAHKLYGNLGTANVLDIVKKMGYDNACNSGISIAVSDIHVPQGKYEIIQNSEKQVDRTEAMYRRGLMTDDERYKKVVEIWNKATDDVADLLKEANTEDKFNPIAMMADSGARGSIDQIKQLAGMRGLMADPSGRIIDRPVKSNFREGLTILEYFISSHGARKGLADTALRTADSGYLTRRLVDVAQDVIVREDDCDIHTCNLMKERNRLCKAELGASAKKIRAKVIGRTLAATIIDEATGTPIAESDTIITNDVYNRLMDAKVTVISIYVPDADDPVGDIREEVVINISQEFANSKIKEMLMHHYANKEVSEDIVNGSGEVLLNAGATLTEADIDRILLDCTVSEISVRNNEIDGIEIEAITENGTEIESLHDRIIGRTLAEDIKDAEGNVLFHINDYITEDMADQIAVMRDKVKIRTVLTCKSKVGVCRKCYGRNLATDRNVDVGEAVGTIAAQAIGEPGTQLTMRTFHTGGVAGAEDITQGLPRVEELFEARKPKHPGILTDKAGTVHIVEEAGQKQRKVIITGDSEDKEVNIPYGAKLAVEEGDTVEIGDRLTEGSLNPHDILNILGPQATQRYIVQQVLSVYKSQGVGINDKHIEVMVRQMMRKIRIEEAGDTSMLPGEYVDIGEYNEQNAIAVAEGKEPAKGRPILLGITKASLATDSFLSAASFQETTRVLTDAAIKGKVDPLLGLKENVIIGKLIPAGTGMSRYRDIKVKYLADVSADEVPVDVDHKYK